VGAWLDQTFHNLKRQLRGKSSRLLGNINEFPSGPRDAPSDHLFGASNLK
jgi:hypothetical protein